jgi:hypothetical protein
MRNLHGEVSVEPSSIELNFSELSLGLYQNLNLEVNINYKNTKVNDILNNISK